MVVVSWATLCATILACNLAMAARPLANVSHGRQSLTQLTDLLFGAESNLHAGANSSQRASGDPRIEYQRAASFMVLGAQVLKAQQTYMGVPVFGHTFTIGLDHKGNPTPEHSYGKVVTGLAASIPSVTPQLSEEQAVATALTLASLKPRDASSHTTALNIFYTRSSADDDDVEAHLAYIVTLQLSKSINSTVVALDAISGELLSSWPLRSGLARSRPAAAPQRLPGSKEGEVPRLPPGTFDETVTFVGGSPFFTGPIYYDGLKNGTAVTVDGVTREAWHGPKLRILRSVDNRTCYLCNEKIWVQGAHVCLDAKTLTIGFLGSSRGVEALIQNFNNSYLPKDAHLLGDKSARGVWGAAPFAFPCPTNASSYNMLPDQTMFKSGNTTIVSSLSASADLVGGFEWLLSAYKDWYGVDVLAAFEAQGVPVPLRVGSHFAKKNNYFNAFWTLGSFVTGDGRVVNGKLHGAPLSGMDVVTHEVSHGVNELLGADLVYASQSGGINEAFSDMAAAAVTTFAYGVDAPEYNVYMIGEMNTPGGFRNMINQSEDGASIICARDFQASMDVHYSSGVFNRAFYLIATAPCWSPRLAFKIFLDANIRGYWTSQTTFTEAFCGVRYAALEAGLPVGDVDAAFKDVCISSTCHRPAQPASERSVPGSCPVHTACRSSSDCIPGLTCDPEGFCAASGSAPPPAPAVAASPPPSTSPGPLPSPPPTRPTQPPGETYIDVTIHFKRGGEPATAQQRAVFASAFKYGYSQAVGLASCLNGTPAALQFIAYGTTGKGTPYADIAMSYPTSSLYRDGLALVVANPKRWFAQLDPTFKSTKDLASFHVMGAGSEHAFSSSVSWPELTLPAKAGC